LDEGISVGDFSSGFEEHTIADFPKERFETQRMGETLLHDVSFMDGSDLLSSGKVGEFESIFSNSSGGFLGDDLDTFNDTRVNFVFDTGIFSFSVFSEDDDINLLVSGTDIGQSSAVGQVGV